jgi:uncharacterized protein
MPELLKHPWPWYVAGPLIGLVAPALFLLGNKSFGISANFRHACAACLPAGISFFRYDWKKESWNLFFILGITAGAFIATQWLQNPAPIQVNPALAAALETHGVSDYSQIVPKDIFNFSSLLTVRGFVMMIIGGFLVGFGSRYAGGCTSGHAITGLATLQWPSLVATICFMAGGFLTANWILPYIL